MEQKSRKSVKALYILLVALGIVAGLAISSRFDLMNDGAAQQKMAVSPELMKLSNGLADVAEFVTPSVVNISTSKTVKEQNQLNPFYSDPFFRRFFGEPDQGQDQSPYREYKQRSLGSGVIVTDDGYIVTNNHVVEGADEITVALHDKKEYKGKVVGTDPRSDVAVIKIEAEGLPGATWGDSDNLRPGEMVMAVGNPFGLSKTVTVGIVSAIGRANVGITDYEDFIQTDAAINPGNSGGSLVNMKGELVGINTAIFSKTGGYQGVGFAVPAKMVRQVMDSLIKYQKVVRGWLGVSVQDLTPALAKQFGVEGVNGALVANVTKDSPAEKSGLRQGDVIVEFDGRPVTDSGHLRNVVGSTPVGTKIDVKVVRDDKTVPLTVTLGELPKDMVGSGAGQQPSTESALSAVSVQELTNDLKDKLGLDSSTKGVVVVNVAQASEAEDAGLARGDVIISINRQKVDDVAGYNRIASKTGKGDSILLLVNRKGAMLWMSISPME